jgi:hypothetical protein
MNDQYFNKFIGSDFKSLAGLDITGTGRDGWLHHARSKFKAQVPVPVASCAAKWTRPFYFLSQPNIMLQSDDL